MTISRNQSADHTPSSRDFKLDKQFYSSTLGLEVENCPLSSKVLKDLSLSGSYYGNSIQMEDYLVKPSQVATQNFSLLPLQADLNELDESFSNFKGINSLFSKFSVLPLGTATSSLAPRSYLSVFNNFRSDFEDFS